jgi:large subunit ribosomal protein L9
VKKIGLNPDRLVIGDICVKVLLCEDIEKLGWYGDVVEVSEGYARNYLLPKRIATIPTEQKIKAMAEEKAKRTEQRKFDDEGLQKAAAAVDGAEAVIAAKVNEQGHLFGSVTEKEIAENLRQQGYEIADKFVQLDGHIKELGEHTVNLKFAANVTAKVKVTVVPQGQGVETADGSGSQTNAE